MFVLDTFLGWVLDTVTRAAEAEMNDDTALREQLLEAELRREMGEISDDEFAALERDLLERIREIKARRSGTGALGFGQPIETAEGGFAVEAVVSGDFHEADEPEAPASASAGGGGDRLRREPAGRRQTAAPPAHLPKRTARPRAATRPSAARSRRRRALDR